MCIVFWRRYRIEEELEESCNVVVWVSGHVIQFNEAALVIYFFNLCLFAVGESLNTCLEGLFSFPGATLDFLCVLFK